MFFKFLIILITLIAGCRKSNQLSSITLNQEEKEGLELFRRMACDACHSIDGSLKLGPTIKNQYGTEIRHTDGTIAVIDADYIRESIIYPLKYIAEGYTPIMPSYKLILKEEEISNIVSYIKSQK